MEDDNKGKSLFKLSVGNNTTDKDLNDAVKYKQMLVRFSMLDAMLTSTDIPSNLSFKKLF